MFVVRKVTKNKRLSVAFMLLFNTNYVICHPSNWENGEKFVTLQALIYFLRIISKKQMKRFFSFAVMILLSTGLWSQNPLGHKKLSPRLSHILKSAQREASSRGDARVDSRMEVLAKLTDDADEAMLAEKYDFTVETRIGRVLIVSIPVNRMADMAQDPQVVRLEAERAGRKLLDVVPTQIGTKKANQGTGLPQAFTGKDVVVGIVDVGFDYTHPMFTDKEWNSRIRWVGDYISKPNKTMTDPQEIKQAMYSPDPYEIHGTHVAGIAVGKEVMRLFAGDDDIAFQGVAQESDIAMGAISLTGDNPMLGDGTSASSVPAIKAFSDIFAFADQQGKPCVVNFSAGVMQTFAHNRQLEEEAIRTLADKPGHAFVVASGNSGSAPYLMHKDAAMEKAGAGVKFIEDEGLVFFGVEVKMKNTQTLRIKYTNSTYTANRGEITVTPTEIPQTTWYVEKRIGSGIYLRTIYADLEEVDGDYSVVYVTCENQFPDADRMLLTVEGEGEAWIYSDMLCSPLENVSTVENHALCEDGYTMNWPASMDEVIAVGNIGWRYSVFGTYGAGINEEPYEKGKGEGYLALSSSQGPTLDGRMKPDVCAPGVCVISALSNGLGWGLPKTTADALEQQYQYYYMGFIDEPENPDFDPNNQAAVWNAYHGLIVMSGTSMSSPAVAGTVALWMQADPTLTTARIKEIIAKSSRQPDSELSYPNNQYGYGEIDAYKGLCYILGIDKIDGVSMHQPQQATFRLKDGVLTVACGEAALAATGVELEWCVYSTDGRLLLKEKGASVNLSALPKGVYAVQLNTGNRITTGSTLIRL